MRLNKPLLFGGVCALLMAAALLVATTQSLAAPNQADGNAKPNLRGANGAHHSAEATLHDAKGNLIGKVKLDSSED